ncbi:MAG: hypothetical protein WBW71_08055 [Bacteroidota bacterium]
MPERGDSDELGNISDAVNMIALFNPSCGAIHWSRTFGERATEGTEHGAEVTEQVVRSFLPECRDAQQHVDDIPPPELQQQQQVCIEADSLPPCSFFRSGAK